MRCGQCSWPVPPEMWNQDALRCPVCRQRIRALAFPAILSQRAGAEPQAVLADTEAACFYHPGSRAAIPCDQCGRFLCSLCDIEIDSRHLCSKCFEAGVASNQLEVAEKQRTMYDTIALALATLPALLFWPAVIGAPAALYVVIRRWHAPGSIVPRTRIRFYLAAVAALGEFAFAAYIVWIFTFGIRALRR